MSDEDLIRRGGAREAVAGAVDYSHAQERIAALPAARPVVRVPSVDELAQIIRAVDGDNRLGAGELAERINAALPAVQPAPDAAALVEAAQWARNRLEVIADDAWYGDGRDFKRALVGVFADFDEALARHGSRVPDELISKSKPQPAPEMEALVEALVNRMNCTALLAHLLQDGAVEDHCIGQVQEALDEQMAALAAMEGRG
jgi:hypothetical protein